MKLMLMSALVKAAWTNNMEAIGAGCPVVVLKRGNARGAKGWAIAVDECDDHASPTIARMWATLAPPARSARKEVARVDFESFRLRSSSTRRW
jgi:hypothetical protein